MKLPRWLVICMNLMALLGTLLALLAGWWVSWPERTTRRFRGLVAQARFDEANLLISPSARWVSMPGGRVLLALQAKGPALHLTLEEAQDYFQESNLTTHSRTLSDLLKGRLSFRTRDYEFHVERGKIFCRPIRESSADHEVPASKIQSRTDLIR